MSNRNECTDKKSFGLERTHNGKFRVLRNMHWIQKYGGLNVCEAQKDVLWRSKKCQGKHQKLSWVVDASKVAWKESSMEDLDKIHKGE